jgi:hypothetical protein
VFLLWRKVYATLKRVFQEKDLGHNETFTLSYPSAVLTSVSVSD